MELRFFKQSDLPGVMQVEREFNSLPGGRLNQWTMSAEEVLAEMKGNCNSSLVVLSQGEVWATFIYEINQVSYDVVYLAIHPKAPIHKVLRLIVIYMTGKAEVSPLRNVVRIYLRDRDEAHIRDILPVLQESGFTVRLARDYYEDYKSDGWCCSYVAE